MITRLLIAATGAIIVTVGLLLAMDKAISLFREESGERYFRITDVLPKPPPGRPERPGAGERQPELAAPAIGRSDAALPIEPPVAAGAEAPALSGPAIELPEAASN